MGRRESNTLVVFIRNIFFFPCRDGGDHERGGKDYTLLDWDMHLSKDYGVLCWIGDRVCKRLISLTEGLEVRAEGRTVARERIRKRTI